MSGESTLTEPLPIISNGVEQAPESSQEAPEVALYPDDVPPDDERLNSAPIPDEAKPEDKSKATEGPLEVYKLTMPNGVALDVDLLNAAAPVLREAGISSEQAQKLVPVVAKVQERFLAQQVDELATMQAQWLRQTKGDREIGGEHFGETKRLVGVALEAAGAGSMSHPLRALMNESGLGDHPVILRAFRNLGKIISEQRRKEELARRSGPRSREENLYPNDQPKR